MDSASTTNSDRAAVQLKLRLRAEPQNAAVARTFVGSALRTIDRDPVVVDDLRLAVSELFAVLVAERCGSIDVTLMIRGEAVTAVLAGTAELPPLPPATLALTRELTGGAIQVEDWQWVIQAPPH